MSRRIQKAFTSELNVGQCDARWGLRSSDHFS